MKKITVLLLAVFCSQYLFAQDIATDSKGKAVFSYYGTKKYRFDFSSKDFSATFATNPIKTQYFNLLQNQGGKRVIVGAGDTSKNVGKSSFFFLQPAILNASDMVSISDMKNFRPGGKLKIGYQRNVDTIYDNYKGATYGFGVNVFGAVDNLKLYNTDSNKVEKRYPYSMGIEGNFTFFPWKLSRRVVLALTGNYTRGWDDNALLNYKDISSATITSAVVAFDKFDGKYGKLNTEVNKLRLTLSIPVTFWHLNPIPYAVCLITNTNQPAYFLGVYTNLLAKKINYRGFKSPSSFGIGVDWSQISGKWSTPNVFIRGSISFGDF
jgi:hypothetical protein